MFCMFCFYIGGMGDATKSAEKRHQVCGDAPLSLRGKYGGAPPSLRKSATKSAETAS